MSKRKKGANKVSLKQNQVTTQVPQNEKINSDTGNVQFISEGIGLEDLVKIEGINNSNNVVKGEENEMNKTQEVKRNHAEIVVDATQQGEQTKVASAVKKVEAEKQEVKPVEESKKEIIPAKVEGGKQEMYKQQTAAMNSAEVATDNNTVTISKADLNALIREAVENAQKANANLPAPQVAIKEEVKEEPKKEEVVEKKEAKEESEENDYSFFFGAAVGAAAVYGGQKLYEYLNDDSAADDASEAFSLISDMF
ncbi:hypothetical protein [Solobacterium sp.]|uniref:hypothetical protein n=1 Tax=Solobacterium sp. TaxID=2060878 RepID=UPI001CAB2579|nr:hypothetical protein [Solobacterium sp.]MBF1100275.1 hypothetical protein [Solobacterium sp.]